MGFYHPPMAGVAGQTGLSVPEFLEKTILTEVMNHDVQNETRSPVEALGHEQDIQPAADQERRRSTRAGRGTTTRFKDYVESLAEQMPQQDEPGDGSPRGEDKVGSGNIKTVILNQTGRPEHEQDCGRGCTFTNIY